MPHGGLHRLVFRGAVIQHEVGDRGRPHPVAAGAVDQGGLVAAGADGVENTLERGLIEVSGRDGNAEVLHSQTGQDGGFIERPRFHRVAKVDDELDAGFLEGLEMSGRGLAAHHEARSRF